MATISPNELFKLLSERPAQTIIDVRTPVEFAGVHVAEAKNVPLDQLNPSALHQAGTISQEKPIYVLCQSGGRAAKAVSQLISQGFNNAIVVDGGTQAWIDAGLPVKRGEGKVISLERQVRIAAGSLVFIGVILGWFVHPYFFGLSAFVGAGLVFAGITDWCGMGLLIAKAPWNRRAHT